MTRETFPSRASQGLRALQTNELVKAGDGWEVKDGTGTVGETSDERGEVQGCVEDVGATSSGRDEN